MSAPRAGGQGQTMIGLNKVVKKSKCLECLSRDELIS
ncbi:MAG: hypothetical protein ACI9SC_003207 [Gammaproteobacteria bacterium]|jgi:hypothetical protein